MTNVLSMSWGADLAGIGFSLVGAFAGTDIEVRSAVRKSNYLDYPTDAPWAAVGNLYDAADVLHVHSSMKSHRMMVEAGHAPKPLVMHHHGSKYRANPRLFDEAVEAHKPAAIAVAATLDLLDHGPHLTWIPHPVDVEALAAFRVKATGKRRMRVGHSPTRRDVKSTYAFLAACEKVDVEPVLIEGRSWNDCLTIKGTCDVLFDQVQLGYGVSAIEAWAMGIPVIAGAAESTLDRMRDEFKTLPFVEATEATIADALDAMKDGTERGKAARRGKAHVKRWHDGRETLARLTPIYAALG